MFRSHCIIMASASDKPLQKKKGSFPRAPLKPNDRPSFEERHITVGTNRDDLITKRQQLCFGARLQPEWESRSLKINPVHSDDVQRFYGNEEHTEKWALARLTLHIVYNNAKRLPYVWGAVLILIQLISPVLLRLGSPMPSCYSNAVVLFASFAISFFAAVMAHVKPYFLGRSIDFKRCHVLQSRKGRLKSVKICDLVVGNIVKLTCDEQVPADMILLACSNPNGKVHIDTSLLDGNTDLKVKLCTKDAALESSALSFANMRGQITCDRPSSDMDAFTGTIRLTGHPRPRNVYIHNFIMKGSILRNTCTAYGVITHTGPDTKIALNIKHHNQGMKLGSIEGIINQLTIIVACIYFLCFVVSMGTRWSVLLVSDRRKRGASLLIESLLFVVIRFVVIYGGMIPVTLPATVDVLRYLFRNLYYGHTDYSFLSEDPEEETPVSSAIASLDALMPSSWPLNSVLLEELGMVDIVFCDKTGTLTTNELKIVLVFVGGEGYYTDDDDIKRLAESDDVYKRGEWDKLLRLMCLCNASTPIHSTHNLDTLSYPIRMGTSSCQSYKHSESRNSEFSLAVQSDVATPLRPSKSKIHFGNVRYMEPLNSLDLEGRDMDAGNNSLDPAQDHTEPNGEDISSPNAFSNKSSRPQNRIQYRSPFKEDECMMDMASEFGYKLSHRSKQLMRMDIHDVTETWNLIGFNDFSHKRRRMSVVLNKEGETGSIALVKGSGETMVTLLKSETGDEGDHITALANRVQKLSSAGYRVIICASRLLSQDETRSYQRHFANAEDMIYSGDALHEEAAVMVENNLTYIGMVVMKDEIQNGVPETLESLMEAGVRVWMTTGDNRHSAVEAAFASNLLLSPCRVFECKMPDNKSDDTLINYGGELYDAFLQERNDKNSSEQLCLVIDGADLEDFMKHSELQTYLINMLCFSDVVIACRLSPSLKAEFVRQVRTRLVPTPVTVAIGDGLNDVKMMQEAHIGLAVVGTFPDVVAYADFATSHFAGLRSLLLYQGSTCLQVTTSAIYWSFFKGLCFIMPVFYYQGNTDWVGLDLYGSFLHLILHLVFTAFHVVLCAMFDKRLSEPVMANLPVLYTLCRRRFHTNLLSFGFWVLEGVLSSFFCYLSIQAAVYEFPVLSGGGTLSARAFGILCSLGSLEMSNATLFVETFKGNLYIGLLWIVIFSFGLPPIFLLLCYWLGGVSLRNASYQVPFWGPIYFLIPVWISIGALFHVASTITQASVSPNMGNYLKHWVRAQNCQCQQQKSKESSEAQKYLIANISLWDKICNRKGFHIWCDHLLRSARREFSLHGLEDLTRMIPGARSFRVRKGDITGAQNHNMNSSQCFVKDNVEETETQKFNKDGSAQRKRASYIIDRMTLRFKDTQLESDYTRDKRRNHYHMNRIWYRTVFLTIGIFYILSWSLDYHLKKAWGLETKIHSFVPPLCVALLLFGCAILTSHPLHFVNHINKALGGIIFAMIVQHIVTLNLMEPLSSLQPILFPIFTYVILNINFIFALLGNVVFAVSTIKHLDTSIHVMPLFIGINVFLAFVGYRMEYNNRKNFLFEFSAKNARRKQYELLNTMLPNFVVSKMINARLNEDGIPIDFDAEEHDCVTVIFCDVYQFQNLVATVEPTILVELLDSLFLAFDRCAEQFAATKIETVFETYLAALGLSRGNVPCPYESAANALDMSLAMVEAARQISYPAFVEAEDGSLIEKQESLPVKIGINSGKVISGLVGAKKPQYALFGDTVNTASRMKTTGEVGYIHITGSTFDLVKNDPTLQFSHRKTSVKGKGVMTTHLLLLAAGSDYPLFESVDSRNISDMSKSLSIKDDSFLTNDSIGNIAESSEKPCNNDSSNRDVVFDCNMDGKAWSNFDGSQSHPVSPVHSPSSVTTLSSSSYERIRIRKLKISLAVGALTEDDDSILMKETLPLITNCTMYSLGTGSGSNAQTKSSKCVKFFRRSNTQFQQSSSLKLSSVLRSESFTLHRGKEEDEDMNHRIDGSDMRMRTREWLQLKFKDKLQEERYRSHFYHNRAHINTIEQTLLIFLITFVAQSILEIAVPRSFEDTDKVKRFLYLKYVPYWTVRSVYIALLFIMWLMFHFKSFSQRVESNLTLWLTFFLNLLFVSAACIFALSNSWAVSKSGFYSQYLNLWLPSDSIEFYFYIVVLHHSSGMLFQTCLLVDALFIIISTTFISSSVVQTPTTSITLFSIPCYIMFNLISAHCKEAIDRRTFYSNEKARMIEARVGQMLNDMLPKSVLEEFKNDRLKMSYCHEKMSFLFSDIVGFTLWANSVDACDVIALLQKLFARFDRNSTKFGLYKLCTIGDAYVAVSEPATEVPSEQEAMSGIEGILQMAYSMIRTIQDVRESFNIPGLNMRIGLHYGSSVGGVVGSGRLRYDLWGMDIQTANFMESHGLPGKICVSERLKLILMTNFPNRFTFSFNKELQVIDRCVRSYILEKDSNDQSPF